MPAPHVAFFMTTLGTGGIGKMRTHLLRELVRKGVRVDLLLGHADGPYVAQIDPKVRIFHLGTSHSLWCLPRLAAYLYRNRPQALVTEKLRGNVAALRSRRLSGVSTRIFASVHGVVSHKLDAENLSASKRQTKYALIRRYYPQNQGFLAVSSGIAKDLVDRFEIHESKVHVVYNPVVTPELMEKSKKAVDHPWFRAGAPPVILSVGRLEPQKDFTTLMTAFALVRKRHDCRLVILGEGSRRPDLERHARELGIEADVSLPGFVENPYAFMAKARLFVLSSAWEGFGNVLVEAMAVGTPVLATDCPSGPGEILEGGRLGALVPVGDAMAMADAMEKVLVAPPGRKELEDAASRYSAVACAESYMAILGLAASPEDRPEILKSPGPGSEGPRP